MCGSKKKKKRKLWYQRRYFQKRCRAIGRTLASTARGAHCAPTHHPFLLFPYITIYKCILLCACNLARKVLYGTNRIHMTTNTYLTRNFRNLSNEISWFILIRMFLSNIFGPLRSFFQDQKNVYWKIDEQMCNFSRVAIIFHPHHNIVHNTQYIPKRKLINTA